MHPVHALHEHVVWASEEVLHAEDHLPAGEVAVGAGLGGHLVEEFVQDGDIRVAGAAEGGEAVAHIVVVIDGIVIAGVGRMSHVDFRDCDYFCFES